MKESGVEDVNGQPATTALLRKELVLPPKSRMLMEQNLRIDCESDEGNATVSRILQLELRHNILTRQRSQGLFENGTVVQFASILFKI
jgi:hypothetical protein